MAQPSDKEHQSVGLCPTPTNGAEVHKITYPGRRAVPTKKKKHKKTKTTQTAAKTVKEGSPDPWEEGGPHFSLPAGPSRFVAGEHIPKPGPRSGKRGYSRPWTGCPTLFDIAGGPQRATGLEETEDRGGPINLLPPRENSSKRRDLFETCYRPSHLPGGGQEPDKFGGVECLLLLLRMRMRQTAHGRLHKEGTCFPFTFPALPLKM